MPDKEMNDYSYEEAIEHIENILAKMDEGDVPLAESMKNFENGMKLIAHCENILNLYERKITKVTEDFQGKIKEEEIE